MKILSFAASTSSTSRNNLLLEYALQLLPASEISRLDLREYPLPLYSYDLEEQGLWPSPLYQLKDLFQSHQAFIIASPEHNGMITAVFKNLIDWLSRLYKPVLGDKPVLLLSTSTGSNGGRSSLEHLAGILPRWGGKVSALFSLADFDSSFDQGLARIRDPRADQALQQAVKLFRNSL